MKKVFLILFSVFTAVCAMAQTTNGTLRQITNIATLRTNTVAVTGVFYYITDPNKQGDFTYVSGDVTSVDDSAAVVVDGAGHRYKRVMPLAGIYPTFWFGANDSNVIVKRSPKSVVDNGALLQVNGTSSFSDTLTATTLASTNDSSNRVASTAWVFRRFAFPYVTKQYLNGFHVWSALNSDSLTEGATNQFYTNTRARASLSATAPALYNNGTGVISVDTSNGLSHLATQYDVSLIYPKTNVVKSYLNAFGVFVPGNTDSLVEGATNQFFTTARARASLSGVAPILYNSSTGAISADTSAGLSHLATQYQVSLIYPKTNVVKSYLNAFGVFAAGNTDSLVEGTTNKFYTDTRARLSLSALSPILYNNSTGVISADTSVGKLATKTDLLNYVSPLTSTYIGVGNTSNLLSGSAGFTYNFFSFNSQYLVTLGTGGNNGEWIYDGGNQSMYLTAGRNISNSAFRNFSMGYQALKSSTGASNIAMGYQALGSVLTSYRNLAIGESAGGQWQSTSYNNIAIGFNAGYTSQDSTQNSIFIGNKAQKKFPSGGLLNTYIIGDSILTDSNNVAFFARNDQRIVLGNGGGNTTAMNALQNGIASALFYNTDSAAYCMWNGTKWIRWYDASLLASGAGITLPRGQIAYGSVSGTLTSSSSFKTNTYNMMNLGGANTYNVAGGFDSARYVSVIGGSGNTFPAGNTWLFSYVVGSSTNTFIDNGNLGNQYNSIFGGGFNTYGRTAWNSQNRYNNIIGYGNIIEAGSANTIIGQGNSLKPAVAAIGNGPFGSALIGTQLAARPYDNFSAVWFGQYNDTSRTNVLFGIGAGSTSRGRYNLLDVDTLGNMYLTPGTTAQRQSGSVRAGTWRINSDSNYRFEVFNGSTWGPVALSGGGGGGSQTLQQVYTTGTTLTQNNTIGNGTNTTFYTGSGPTVFGLGSVSSTAILQSYSTTLPQLILGYNTLGYTNLQTDVNGYLNISPVGSYVVVAGSVAPSAANSYSLGNTSFPWITASVTVPLFGRRTATGTTSINSSDYMVAYTSLPSGANITLPSASTVPNHYILIKDESGAASSGNSIVINGTVEGVTNPTAINTAYGIYRVYSNGSVWLKW